MRHNPDGCFDFASAGPKQLSGMVDVFFRNFFHHKPIVDKRFITGCLIL
jgi:hypothetical protein